MAVQLMSPGGDLAGTALPEHLLAQALARGDDEAFAGICARARPAITLCWIREAPARGAVARPLHRPVMQALTDMLVTLTSSAGFRRAGLDPITPPIALILLGGLRELTALFVEDGRDMSGIAGPAVVAATALLGPH